MSTSTARQSSRNDAPFGTWQNRYIDWVRDPGFLRKPGVPTKAAEDIATFLTRQSVAELPCAAATLWAGRI